MALAGTTLRRAFTLGLVTGAVYFTGTLYWITGVMATYGDMARWVAVLINAGLVVYQTMYVAIFALVVRRIVIAHGPPALMAAPIVWVATELGRTHIFTGFPWVLLGYSQTTVLPIAQFASLFGVYGVSMLVASVSAALAVRSRSSCFAPLRGFRGESRTLPAAARRRLHHRDRRRGVGQPPRGGGRVDAHRRARFASA